MAQVWNKYDDGIPAGAIYVGRPTKWGNPFKIGRDGSRQEVVAKYRAWLLARPALVTQAKAELKGRDLVCSCSPASCHADVLMEVSQSAD